MHKEVLEETGKESQTDAKGLALSRGFSGCPSLKTLQLLLLSSGSIPGLGTKIPQAVWSGQRSKSERN